MKQGAWRSDQKFLASVMQIIGQFVPGIVFLCQTPRTAAAIGQLGVVATHESAKRVGHGVDGNFALPSPTLSGGLGKMAGIGANDRKFAG